MICPTCAAPNADTAKFCTECGGPLDARCPACGTPHRPSQRFCAECGAALAAPAAVVPSGGPAAYHGDVAERRLVTVLFADLVGFTTLSERRDAEEVRDLLSRYFATCRRLIGLYGGTVEKFIGDAVMAVWGTPTATEDDAERAVRAALDLVAAISALGEEVGAPEPARAGRRPHRRGGGHDRRERRGDGRGRPREHRLADPVASRSPAPSSSATRPGARPSRRSSTRPPARSSSRARTGLVSLWRALRVVSGARGALKSQGLEAPFVGRDRELRLIKDLFHACADEHTRAPGVGDRHRRHRQVAGGVGVLQVLRRAGGDRYWHRGRCLAYGEGVTYWALADMVRMRCRIGEDEGAEPALAKLRATLEEHILDDEERRFVEPRLAHLLGARRAGGA